MRLAADVGHLDLAEVRGLLGAELRVAVGSALPHGADRRVQLLVSGSRTQDGAQVVAADREEAGVELPVRRQAGACAVAAEGLRDGGDHTDFPGAVAGPVALGDLAPVARLDGLERGR